MIAPNFSVSVVKSTLRVLHRKCSRKLS